MPGRRLRYPIPSDRLRVVGPGPIDRLWGLRHIRHFDAIVVHEMDSYAALATVLSRKAAVTVWSGYGWDYYGDSMSPFTGLLDPLTSGSVNAADARDSSLLRIVGALK